MINYVAYRKFVTLKNGKRVMFRFLNEQDRDGLIHMFQEAPDEDTRFPCETVDKGQNQIDFSSPE